MRRAAPAAALAAALLLWPAQGHAQREGEGQAQRERDRQAQQPAPPTCEEVFSRVEQRERYAPFVVGDSVTVPAGDFLGEMGFAVDAMACRTFAQGLAVMAQRRLPDTVVIALGSNAAVTAAELEQALEMVGPFGRLFLVLPKQMGGARDPDGQIMRAFERAHPDQVTTLDWPAYSEGRSGWFAPDGLHITTDGARGFAEMINEAVQFAPAEQVKPPSPREPRARVRPPAERQESAPDPLMAAVWSHLGEAIGAVLAPGVRLLGRVIGDTSLPKQDL